MRSFLNISPDEADTGAGGGGGPDDDSQFPTRTLRSHGFLAIAFGFALGLTLMIFFIIFKYWGAPTYEITTFVKNTKIAPWLIFLYGLIGGTIISGVYNLFVFRKLNLFGTGSNVD